MARLVRRRRRRASARCALLSRAYARGLAHARAQLATTLAFIHARGVAHRDLSPENVVLTCRATLPPAAGRLKLIDFGLSGAMASDGMLPARPPAGKAFYTAPELLRGAVHSGAPADMWALGTVLFVMLTGTPAWAVASRADPDFERVTARGELRLVLAERGVMDCPRQLLDLLAALLQPDPARRPTAAEVAAACAGGAGGGELVRLGASKALSPSVSPLAPPISPAAAGGGGWRDGGGAAGVEDVDVGALRLAA